MLLSDKKENKWIDNNDNNLDAERSMQQHPKEHGGKFHFRVSLILHLHSLMIILFSQSKLLDPKYFNMNRKYSICNT